MFKTVLIPVDVSVPEDALALMAAAQRLTEGWDCALHVVTVTPDVGMAIVGSYMPQDFESTRQAKVTEDLAALVAQAGIAAQSHVLSGTIYDRIIAHASELGADLIVIGAHRPELRDYLLGSNAARLVRHSNASVLVLRD